MFNVYLIFFVFSLSVYVSDPAISVYLSISLSINQILSITHFSYTSHSVSPPHAHTPGSARQKLNTIQIGILKFSGSFVVKIEQLTLDEVKVMVGHVLQNYFLNL